MTEAKVDMVQLANDTAMEIKELMCGDYIYDNRFVEPRICRVKNVDLYTERVTAEPLCSPRNTTRLDDFEIDPIPLTKEMLLANGWKDDLTLPYEKKNYYYNGLKLYPHGNTWIMTYSGNNQCCITYVHELQRIMKALHVHWGEEFKIEER